MEHVNGLTHAEAERLSKLIGDLSEVQKVVSDILVHGYKYTPRGSLLNNRALLTQKVANLQCCLGLLIGSKDLNTEQITRYMDEHMKTMFDFLYYHQDIAQDLVTPANDEKKGWTAAVVDLFSFRKKRNEFRPSVNH